MKPVLFYLGTLPIYSYGVFLVMGYVSCVIFGWMEAKRLKQDPIHVIDLSIIIFVAAIVGARLLFVIVAYERFLEAPLDALKLWKGGLVFWGGLLLAITLAMVYIKRMKLPFWLWADLAAPTAMLSLIFGRTGCLLNGCCYGAIAPDLPWGIIYPVGHRTLGLYQTKVHPTPVYSIIAAATIFLILNVIQRKKRFEGQTFLALVILYSAARFTIEFFRADFRGTVAYINLSTSQTISLALGVAALVAMVMMISRTRRSNALTDAEVGSQAP